MLSMRRLRRLRAGHLSAEPRLKEVGKITFDLEPLTSQPIASEIRMKKPLAVSITFYGS